MRIKDFPVLSIFPSSFLRGFFQVVDPNSYICIYFSCHEQCCLFEFPNLAVILKHSRCFINFIPILMADPSPSFVLALMTWAFKKESLRVSNTTPSFPKNTLFPFPFLHRFLLLKHSYPFTPIKPSYHGAREKPRLLPP